MLNIPPDWAVHLHSPKFAEALARVSAFLEQETALSHTYFPRNDLVFNALVCTPYEKVKVVIVGQDPYHGPNQAHGLSFSVPQGVPLPPSLQNIYKELQEDLQIPRAQTGNLVPWALQGVVLLNATLTVRAGEPLSHHGRGWEEVTDGIIEAIAAKQCPIVFILWGRNAQEKCSKFALERNTNHLVLKAAHPSPFSAYSGFFGCRHFSKTNAFLEQHGVVPIDWQVPQAAALQTLRGIWDVEIDEETL